MAEAPRNLYAAWRAQARAELYLREVETAPPEKLLQEIWQRQRILREQLKTVDGRKITVLHPGFLNRQAGPDFNKAIIQIGNQPAQTGDVEIDLEANGWTQHGHDTNPAYRNVLLHVVWESSERQVHELPCLALKPHLDAPWPALAEWLGSADAPTVVEQTLGKCSGPLKDLNAEKVEALLLQAAEVRLMQKGEQLQARARQCGWEQALWEGLFAGLGYKHNSWPMRRIAELIPALRSAADGEAALEARFLGVSGLLPRETSALKPAAADHLKKLWTHWWRDQAAFAADQLPRTAWRMDGLRPANHPQRRVALGAIWAQNEDLVPQLERWFMETSPQVDSVANLMRLLQPDVGPDGYWSRHWTFRSAPMNKPQPLLGDDRVSDLAINVVLPWFWTRARAGRNSDFEQRAKDRYFRWPASQDNSALKLARTRLFGGAAPIRFNRAALQQGLLQITRDFCDHSNALCQDCIFPQLVRSF